MLNLDDYNSFVICIGSVRNLRTGRVIACCYTATYISTEFHESNECSDFIIWFVGLYYKLWRICVCVSDDIHRGFNNESRLAHMGVLWIYTDYHMFDVMSCYHNYIAIKHENAFIAALHPLPYVTQTNCERSTEFTATNHDDTYQYTHNCTQTHTKYYTERLK